MNDPRTQETSEPLDIPDIECLELADLDDIYNPMEDYDYEH